MPARLAVLALFACARLAVAGASCRIAEAPPELYEATAFEVEAAYQIPAAAGAVPLHCELKAEDHAVLQSEVVRVSGQGTHRFRLTGPARRRTRQAVIALWLGDDWRKALSPIQFSPPIPVYSQEDKREDEQDREEAANVLNAIGYRRSPRGAVAILSDGQLDGTESLARKLADALLAPKAAAPCVTRVGCAHVENRFVVNREHFDLLVLTDARTISARGLRTVRRFLAEGGSLVAVGTPAFGRIVRRVGERWLDASQIRDLLWATEPKSLLFGFEQVKLDGWSRASNEMKAPSVYETVHGGKSGRCLRARIPKLSGWDGLKSPELGQPFPKGHTLTCFWAKGSPRTTELAIEWVEADGSRWIATVPLGAAWRQYALPPEAFRYWQDSRSKGRGGPGDRLNPAKAGAICFQLAFTHTHVPPGDHAFWVDEVGTAPNPHPELTRLAAEEAEGPALDTLAPGYKFYPVTSARRLGISSRQVLVPAAEVPRPAALLSSHARPQGTGCDKGRKWRWVPLIEATDSHGRRCGFPATLLVHATRPYEGGAWAAFSYTPREIERSDALRSTVAALVRRMLDGVWLLEGGSQWYTYFADAPAVTLGATVANFGRAEATVRATLRILPAGGGEAVFEKQSAAALKPGQRRDVRAEWAPEGFPQAPYRVVTLLERDGRLIDRLEHELHCRRAKKAPSFTTTRGLDFVLDGEPWHPHGVNYMPSSGVAIEDGGYFERWLGSFPYDPEVVQTDLERVAEAGMNAVSLFVYHGSIDSGNLLDILRRCEALGLKVNLSLRPGTPLDFRWDEMRAIVERYRLARCDTVFAYDLAWEPMFRQHAQRRRHDEAWAQWIAEQYGSVDAAEKDWKCPCPRDGGTIANPSNEQVSRDGPWRVMVAAYRRFLDDLLAEHYVRAQRLVRSVDPNHLVSFRMTVAGDPTISHGWSLPYDFRATAPGVAITQPEGYGRIGDWEKVKGGIFTVAYARCVAPGRPCLWAEFGRSVWDRRRMRPDPELIEWTAAYYERFYRMALTAEAAGTICWWYPGGYRVGEDSDYGIINPDGSDRPITKVIRRHAAAFARRRERSTPRRWIAIDRDAHPGGLPAVYQAVKDDFWAAMDRGEFPGLRHDGQGTTSADCPLVAVGNVPCTGHNPPKHLNAVFAKAEIRNREGQWEEASQSGHVLVAAGPVRARVVIINNGFATWLSPKGREQSKGTVQLVVRDARTRNVLSEHPIASDVPYLGEAALGEIALMPPIAGRQRVILETVAKGRSRFGRRLTIALSAPAP